jgi:predicted MFS family arabinose efflux permease
VTLAQLFWFVAGNGDLRRLWVGRTTSVIGDRMFAVGAIWIAWSLTHSSAGVACIILAESLPFLAWGALRRRVTIRVGVRTLAGLDLIRAGLLLGLFSLSYDEVITKACGVALVASIAFLTAIFEPAFRSLIPELVPVQGRQAYASFDLGGRLARIAGPLLAAAITWAGSPRGLIAADIATFLVSAFCLARTADPHAVQAAPQQPVSPAKDERLPPLARALIRANGLGTFALIVWWLALPIAAAHHARGASTYGLCIGVSAAGGILANLVLSRAPDRHQPITLCTVGWAVTALCIGALAVYPSPLPLLAISLIGGIALASAALGFSFHAANLPLPQRIHLFQQDQVVMRTAGAAGAVLGGIALAYWPHAALISTAALLAVLAGSIWRSGSAHNAGLIAHQEAFAGDGRQV